jgi:ATP/maltotriose-dependent transcriptional regulator MalT
VEPDVIARAHEAARGHDWDQVRSLFGEVDLATLPGEVLELLADADWWTNRLEQSLALRHRAYAAFVAEGNARRASFCAWYLWFDHRFKGDAAVASGWLTRAGRHVEAEPDCLQAAFVTVAHAESARAEGDVDRALAHAAAALDLGLRINSADIVALATVTRGECAIARSRHREGLAYLDDAMCSVVAGELTPLVTGIVYCSVLSACFAIADLGRAEEWSRAAVEWCDSLRGGSPYQGICRVHRVEVSTLQGDWEAAEIEAVRAGDELLALDPGAAGEAFYAIGEIRRRRGDLGGAETAFVRAHELGRNPQPGLALLRLRQARPTDATACLRIAVAELPAEPLPRAAVLAAQVEIALEVGELAAARTAAGALDELAESATGTIIEGLAAYARATLLLADDDADEARACAQRAWTLLRDLRLPHEAALARAVLGLATREIGDPDRGRLELEAAQRALVQLGARSDATRVEGLLRTTVPERPRGLTAREVEVLRLVAAGKTNREIAHEMYLSEHTVSRHLQNMFAKLDVSSRAAATAFAYEHHLV